MLSFVHSAYDFNGNPNMCGDNRIKKLHGKTGKDNIV